MKARFYPEFAVLLATLLLLNLSGLCVGIVTETNQQAHPCCPKNQPVSTSPVDCCIVSGIPVTPQALLLAYTPDCVSLPVLADPPAPVGQSHTEIPVASPVSALEPLFLRFHQLLI
jgi:hypothetical protein